MMRSGKNGTSRAALRKGHGAMKRAGDERVTHGGAPPKGYAGQSTLTRGSKRGRR